MNLFRYLVFGGFALIGSGCSSLPNLRDINPFAGNNSVESIGLYIAPDSKLSYAVSVDVLFLYSEDSVEAIGKLESKDWFSQKAFLKATMGNEFELLEWQLVHAHGDIERELPRKHEEAVKVIAFARTPDFDKKLKVELTDMEAVWLIFKNGQLTAQENNPGFFES